MEGEGGAVGAERAAGPEEAVGAAAAVASRSLLRSGRVRAGYSFVRTWTLIFV